MQFPKTVFVSGLEAQAKLICFLASNIVRKLYQSHDYVVLPSVVPGLTKGVFIPDLAYSETFWETIRRAKNSNYDMTIPEKAVSEVLAKLKSDNSKRDFESEWQKIASKFWTICSRDLQLQPIIDQIRSIEVLPTQYGTTGSFYVSKGVIRLTYRMDLPITSICKTLLLVINKLETNTSVEIGEENWWKRHAQVEFALIHSRLSQIVTELKMSVTAKLTQDSRHYLTKLGFEKTVNIDLSKVRSFLTVKEYLVVEKLLQDVGKVVSYSDLGDVVWGNQVADKYSLYALNKHVQQARKKLRLQGLGSYIIRTAKGQGYYI